jgi:hypothetical protein
MARWLLPNKVGLFSRAWKAATSVSIASSLAVSPMSYADEVSKTVISGTKKLFTENQKKLLASIDDVLALTDKGSKNLTATRNLLYRTAIHESGGLKYTKQIGGGPARSWFQIEYNTAKDIVQRYAARTDKKGYMSIFEKFSGKTRKEILALDKTGLNDVVQNNLNFSTTVARLKYKMVPDAVPTGLDAQSKYWGKYYQSKSDPKKIKQFIEINKKYEINDLMAKTVKEKLIKPTSGLTNNVMHNKKTMHQIEDIVEKTKHLFKQ